METLIFKIKKTMLKSFIILLFIFSFVSNSNAQIGWSSANSIGTTLKLTSVCFVNNIGYATAANGSSGDIVKTTDGGLNWTSLFSPSNVNQPLNSIYFSSTNIGYACGGYGKIIKTANGGNTWVDLTSNQTTAFFSSYFITDSIGFVVGENGVVLKTINGGNTWSSQTLTGSWLRSIFFTNSTNGYIVGDNGTLFKTVNGGTSWIAQNIGVTNSFSTIFFTNQDTGFIVGNLGFFAKTVDAGATWNSYGTGISSTLKSVFFENSNVGYACGYNFVVKTIDGGLNWNYQTTPGTSNIYTSVCFTNSLNGHIVGYNNITQNGIAINTTNGGECLSSPNVFAGNDQYICSGQTTTLTATSDSLNCTYSWNHGAGNTAQVIVAPSVTTTYIVTATNNGCTATDDVVVNVNVVFQGQDLCLIKFDTSTYKNKIIWEQHLGVGIDSVQIFKKVSLYSWNKIGTVSNSLTEFIDYSSAPQATADEYKIKIVDACGDTSSFSSVHKSIKLDVVYNYPSGLIYSWGNYLVNGAIVANNYTIFGITTNGSVDTIASGLVPSTIGNNSYTDYNVIPTNYVKFFVGFDVVCGAKTVYVVESNSVKVQDIIMSIEDGYFEKEINIFPNPATYKTTITFGYLEASRITLFDIAGKQIQEYNLEKINSFELSCENLMSGLYFVNIQTKNKNITKKLIVEKQ